MMTALKTTKTKKMQVRVENKWQSRGMWKPHTCRSDRPSWKMH